ncbi:YciI family protein [Caulobacter vibrioides]|uniref:YCII-related domain-containing protein n=2 Tax=Caulobacter vibrioides TaxID=155892 RepID=Q9AB44_CAUVC|nr:conserved hypothetical protein [Caulobacter vibrioides CB15]ATC23392.1 YciI family protein [Caulobacter vibrioides]ATC27220.1 YciI family protein [Caulobacter vibrioides]AZH11602.1 YciI family protein [Caulobacter vibrioides]PLR11336.1 YciI family protein [Caulobacter vibrioides]
MIARQREKTMQYALLLYENEAVYAEEGAMSLEAIIAAHNAFAADLAQQGVLRGGQGLKSSDTATTLRKSRGAETLHDGPYAEAREQLGGFYVIDVPDLDAALAIAKRIPFAGDGAVEVRPIIDED